MFLHLNRKLLKLLTTTWSDWNWFYHFGLFNVKLQALFLHLLRTPNAPKERDEKVEEKEKRIETERTSKVSREEGLVLFGLVIIKSNGNNTLIFFLI